MNSKTIWQWIEFLALAAVIVLLVLFLKHNGAGADVQPDVDGTGSAIQTAADTHSELRPHFIYEGRTYWLSATLETCESLPAGYEEAQAVDEIVVRRAVEPGQASGCEIGSMIYASETAPGVCYLLPPDGTVYFQYDFVG